MLLCAEQLTRQTKKFANAPPFLLNTRGISVYFVPVEGCSCWFLQKGRRFQFQDNFRDVLNRFSKTSFEGCISEKEVEIIQNDKSSIKRA